MSSEPCEHRGPRGSELEEALVVVGSAAQEVLLRVPSARHRRRVQRRQVTVGELVVRSAYNAQFAAFAAVVAIHRAG